MRLAFATAAQTGGLGSGSVHSESMLQEARGAADTISRVLLVARTGNLQQAERIALLEDSQTALIVLTGIGFAFRGPTVPFVPPVRGAYPHRARRPSQRDGRKGRGTGRTSKHWETC